ncbi:MAG: hypothetical protein OEU56_18850 [Rhodospirillales bacterium]|nr:hypothetical protein [Rhodospirillales bacterium]
MEALLYFVLWRAQVMGRGRCRTTGPEVAAPIVPILQARRAR